MSNGHDFIQSLEDVLCSDSYFLKDDIAQLVYI